MSTYQEALSQFPSLMDFRKVDGVSGKKEDNYFGYHCVFTPEEIIHAAGFIPVRMFPTSDSDSYDGKCFHARSCDLARKLLENYSDGKFDYLDGSVFTHCCDTLRAVYETLTLKKENVFYVDTPLSMNSSYEDQETKEADVNYFANQFKQFSKTLLDTYGVEVTDTALRRSLDIYRENRKLMRSLEERYFNGHISTADYFVALRAGYCMRKEAHSVLLKQLLDALETESANEKSRLAGKAKVLLAGGINANYGPWVEYLERLGVAVVSDDLCEFARYQMDNEQDDDDPYRQLVLEGLEKYCPVKVNIDDRFEKLHKKYLNSGAEGIIFMIYQYCDVQQIDYSEMKDNFIEHGIPTLVLSPTVHFKESGQIDTRVEAFVEMIQFG